MSSDHKNIIYNAGDIEQYLAGKLSQQQMHAMEKAALDDPFLAEAMEGYEAMKDAEWNNQLVALRAEIAEKGSVAKVIPLHKSKNNWWKTAAAVLIVCAGAALTFVLTRNNTVPEEQTQQIAQTITASKDTSTQNEAPVSVTASVNPTASDTKEELNKLREETPQAAAATTSADDIVIQPGATQVKTAESKTVELSPIVTDIEDKNMATASAPKRTAENENTLLAEETSNAKNKAIVKANSAVEMSKQKSQGSGVNKKEQALNNYFTAQVVGADNSPLPFTNIAIKKENFGTYADAKGMVRLVSTDSVLNIDVRSVGYLPKTITLRNNQPQSKIILQEDAFAEKDKTVIGNMDMAANQKSRRATLLIDSVINVEPADGWENYNTYVANNLEIPEEMLKRDFHGEVELSFDVKSNGTISNIRVNKSLGAEYDEAAKRLIMEGPQWKVKKGKNTSASVKVKF